MKNCDILLDVEILEESYEGLIEDPIVVAGTGDSYLGPTHVIPAEESQILNTTGFHMNDDITVEAIPSNLIDTTDATLNNNNQLLEGVTAYASNTKYSGTIVTRNTSDITITGSVVAVPSGYYSTDLTATVASGYIEPYSPVIDVTPVFSINSSTGQVTATIAETSDITPALHTGYISAIESGVATISGSSNYQLVTKTAASYTPTTYNQTITAGQYLTGTQTIAGDSNLIAGNIKAGTSIFGVTGNYERLGDNHTATIINRDKNIHYSFIEYNGQTYQNLNDTFTFQAGNTLIIETDSQSGGGKIYINDELVASDDANKVTYNYILPDYDIEISLFESHNRGTVYIFTSYIVISENSKYDVSDYATAYVEVTYPLQSFYESIPIFTITSDIIDGVQSITCNKTYEECVYQISGVSNINTTAIIDHHVVHNGGDYGHSYSGAIGSDEDEHLQYGPAMQSYDSEGNFIGWLDIYWVNGSNITLIPSMFQFQQS